MTGTFNIAGLPWQTITVQVPSASVLNMYTVPVILLPSTSASYLYQIQSVILFCNYRAGSTSYSGGGTIVVEYGAQKFGAGPPVCGTLSSGIFNAVASPDVFPLSFLPATTTTNLSASLANPVSITNQSGVFTTGTFDVYVTICYNLINPLAV